MSLSMISSLCRLDSMSCDRLSSESSITSCRRGRGFLPVHRGGIGVEYGDSSASMSSLSRANLGVSCCRRNLGVEANCGLGLGRKAFGRGGTRKGDGVWIC